jgi:hypothetical protein
LHPENPAIVAGFYVGYADEQRKQKEQQANNPKVIVGTGVA